MSVSRSGSVEVSWSHAILGSIPGATRRLVSTEPGYAMGFLKGTGPGSGAGRCSRLRGSSDPRGMTSSAYSGEVLPMFILTPDRKSISTEKELTAAFEEHRDHGYGCFQLHGDDGTYVSAIGEGFGPYLL